MKKVHSTHPWHVAKWFLKFRMSLLAIKLMVNLVIHLCNCHNSHNMFLTFTLVKVCPSCSVTGLNKAKTRELLCTEYARYFDKSKVLTDLQ